MTALTKSPAAQRVDARNYWTLLALGGFLLALAGFAFYMMEHHGHVVSGMNNQVVWGVPHVFAIFLIVAASGVLNVASIGSVFGKPVYKARAPLSGLLSIAMLTGGLAVLALDLGRPDRLIVAMTHFNFRSVFAWNMFFYGGLFAIVAAYLWTLMDFRGRQWTKTAGMVAFLWRLALTTATGSIFAFLIARQAYGTAVLAPMFIVLSFAWGLAAFMIVQRTMYRWNGLELHPSIRRRMKNLLGIFVAAGLYFVVVYHLTNLYFARQTEFERFILVDGGIFPLLFWVGYVLLGTALPLLLIFHPMFAQRSGTARVASVFVIVGAFALLYVLIIGGQSYPLEIFPGKEVSSSFMDGQVDHYRPSLYEVLLGLGGMALAFVITTVGVRVLQFMPQDDFRQLESAQNITD